MGNTHLLQFPISATAPSPPPPQPLTRLLLFPLYRNPSSSRFSNGTRCRSDGYGDHGGGRPHWDSKSVRAEEGFKFSLDDDDDKEDNNGFGSRSGGKKRVWWSENSMGFDDDDDDEEEEGFGVLEDSINMTWILKVLNAFGWMVPVVVISLLLGTGPNAFFMALVLPLAQSAFSFVTDSFWGRSSGSPNKPKRKTKKKPFARASSDIGMDNEREDIESGNVRANYESTGGVSTKKRNKRAPSFGGWDELDNRVGSYRVPKTAPTQKANEPMQQKLGKLSRRARRRDTPLLLRLFIAVFPFLGSWTKLLW